MLIVSFWETSLVVKNPSFGAEEMGYMAGQRTKTPLSRVSPLSPDWATSPLGGSDVQSRLRTTALEQPGTSCPQAQLQGCGQEGTHSIICNWGKTAYWGALVSSDSLQLHQTIALQAPLSLGFSRQEYWSGLPCPLPGDLPNPGIKLMSLSLVHWQVGSLPLVPPGKP